MVYVHKRCPPLALKREELLFRPDEGKRVLAYAWAAALQQAVVCIGRFLIQGMLSGLGTNTVTGYNMGMRAEAFLFCFAQGTAAALAVCQLLPDTPADLDGLRCRLDETDAAILELFDRRQRLSAAIGAYKSSHGLPVRDKAREAEVLRTRGDMLPERRDQAERLMTLLMALSREEQA